jgi:hypothetical protein
MRRKFEEQIGELNSAPLGDFCEAQDSSVLWVAIGTVLFFDKVAR